MTNIDKDFYRQLAGEITRKLMVAAATLLVTHGWISAESQKGLTSGDFVQIIVSAILFAIPLAWSYAKQKYNVAVVREARAADKNTSIEQIKTETLSKSSFISSV